MLPYLMQSFASYLQFCIYFIEYSNVKDSIEICTYLFDVRNLYQSKQNYIWTTEFIYLKERRVLDNFQGHSDSKRHIERENVQIAV